MTYEELIQKIKDLEAELEDAENRGDDSAKAGLLCELVSWDERLGDYEEREQPHYWTY